MRNIGKKAGGKRVGAGRKSGSGMYKEPTSVMRVPTSQKAVIADFLTAYIDKQQKRTHQISIDVVDTFEFPDPAAKPMPLNLYHSKVPAGIPSPADDHVEKKLDPSEYLIDQADSTFFVTIQGESMIEAGLIPDDKAVVDRSRIAAVGDIILAMIDGEFTIKTLAKQKNGNPRLLPANSSGDYSPINIEPPMQFEVWGVVTGSFRRFK